MQLRGTKDDIQVWLGRHAKSRRDAWLWLMATIVPQVLREFRAEGRISSYRVYSPKSRAYQKRGCNVEIWLKQRRVRVAVVLSRRFAAQHEEMWPAVKRIRVQTGTSRADVRCLFFDVIQ